MFPQFRDAERKDSAETSPRNRYALSALAWRCGQPDLAPRFKSTLISVAAPVSRGPYRSTSAIRGISRDEPAQLTDRRFPSTPCGAYANRVPVVYHDRTDLKSLRL